MKDEETKNMNCEIEHDVDESLFDGKSKEFITARKNVIKAKDTVEETYEELNDKRPNSESGIGLGHGCVDIDDAKWNKEYQQRGNKNLELLKSLGLYKNLQDLGILYDVNQFRKIHNLKTKTITPLDG